MDERRRGAHSRNGEDRHRRLARQRDPPASGAGSLVRQGPEQKDEGKAYRALVEPGRRALCRAGCYVILDLHWSDAGEWGKQIGQHVMPDQNSVEFWKSCATAYKNHPAVIFDLYNEPHDVTWDVWQNGGQVTREGDATQTPAKTYQAVGMQALLDTVRATGAKNVVIVGGLDWAYDMSGSWQGKQLADPDGQRRDLCQSCVSVQGRHGRALARQDGKGREGAADHRQRVRLGPEGRED